MKLGDTVKDSITGFEGIMIAETKWIDGCTRAGIQPTTLMDGLPIPERWFDVQRVKVIEEKTATESSGDLGGIENDPRRCNDPSS